MLTINQISKGGTVYNISAAYDDLDNKISEHYSSKDELTAQLSNISDLITAIQELLVSITSTISSLEERIQSLESSVEDWEDGGVTNGEASELDA